MNENMEVVGTESTTSMTATESTETGAAASAQVDTTVATEGNVSGEGTTPPPAETEGATQQTAVTEDDNAIVSVPFNHEIRELTLEEARTYAQKGMKMDALKPTLDKLQIIAAANGRTFKQTVDDLFSAYERQHYDEILRNVDGDKAEADRLMAERREQWNVGVADAKKAEMQEEKDAQAELEDHLASGLLEISQNFPDVKELADVPKEVVNDAVRNGRNLYDAFLRYRLEEDRKATQNQQAQQRAAAASTGSKTDTSSGVSAATSALLGGLSRALR